MPGHPRHQLSCALRLLGTGLPFLSRSPRNSTAFPTTRSLEKSRREKVAAHGKMGCAQFTCTAAAGNDTPATQRRVTSTHRVWPRQQPPCLLVHANALETLIKSHQLVHHVLRAGQIMSDASVSSQASGFTGIPSRREPSTASRGRRHGMRPAPQLKSFPAYGLQAGIATPQDCK